MTQINLPVTVSFVVRVPEADLVDLPGLQSLALAIQTIIAEALEDRLPDEVESDFTVRLGGLVGLASASDTPGSHDPE